MAVSTITESAYKGSQMSTTYIVPNVALEKLRQKARRLKSELGIPHHQALEQSAIQGGFNNWHQVVDSAKLTSVTQKAYYSGLIIAMDVKDAQDFDDPQKRFVEDDQICHLAKTELIDHYKNILIEDEVELVEAEFEADFEEYMCNYIYFRYDGSTPNNTEEVLKLVNECSFWSPVYFWLNGVHYTT